jgi:hypothetical protein
VKEDEMGKACSTNGEKTNAYRILVGKPEGKRPLGSPISGWVDNIKTDFREIVWGAMDWIDLAQDVNTDMNLGFHKMLENSSVTAQLAASQEGLSSMSE